MERLSRGLTWGALVCGLWFFKIIPPRSAASSTSGSGTALFGVMPVLSGVRRVAQEIADRSRSRQEALEGRKALEVERRDSLEKTVLQIAKERRSIGADIRECSLRPQARKAEKVLGDMAARGHAEMRIKKTE